jgi:hypothetical protein
MLFPAPIVLSGTRLSVPNPKVHAMPIRTLPRLALFLPVLPGLLAAQGFRLEDYEPAPYHRHFLSLAPGISWEARGESRDRDTTRTESMLGNGSPSLWLAFGSRAWDPSREWNLGAGLQVGGTGYGTRGSFETEAGFIGPLSEETRYTYGDGRSLASGSASYRKSLGRSWFLEPAGKGSLIYAPNSRSRNRSWERHAQPIPSDSVSFTYRTYSSRRDNQSGEATLSFAVGLGRILDVGFASTGLFMLDRLAESGAPAAHLDAQGMRDLENHIESRRKQRPFLDRRRAAIYDMATVERFLAARGGAPIPAEALLAMADEWANPSPIPRKRGWELKAYPFLRGSWREDRLRDGQSEWSALRPAAEDEDRSIAAVTAGSQWRSSGSRSRSFQGEREYGMAVNWEYQRPWRRRFQFALGADGRYSDTRIELGTSSRNRQSYGQDPEVSAYLEQNYAALSGNLLASATWIPESRSWVKASWTAYSQWKGNQPPPDGLFEERSAWDASARADLVCGYEISPRLAVRGSLAWDGSRSDGFWREPDYTVYRYRFEHRVNTNSTWHADLSFNYYLF